MFNLISKRRQFAGSLIRGIAETQEMLDFCAAHNLVSDIELIPIQKVNEACRSDEGGCVPSEMAFSVSCRTSFSIRSNSARFASGTSSRE